MDFFEVGTRTDKQERTIFFPMFFLGAYEGLMVRGKEIMAFWDAASGMWCTDIYKIFDVIDRKVLEEYEASEIETKRWETIRNHKNNLWYDLRRLISSLPDRFVDLDTKVTFKSEKTDINSYVSRRLNYDLSTEEPVLWNRLINTLYNPTERDKLEWAIGSIFTGDAQRIQKFIVLHGDPGSGKSTVIKIIEGLFEGYDAHIDVRALGSNYNQFATAALKENPLVALQDDADLSKIQYNETINMIVSHESTIINEKNKPAYEITPRAFIFVGTNQPVRITSAKSGLIRRMIVVEPSGRKLGSSEYFQIMSQIKHEYGAIANHCMKKFESMGPDYYRDYIPIDMIYATNPIVGFLNDQYSTIKNAEFVTASNLYQDYKSYCDSSGVTNPLSKREFVNEARHYFRCHEYDFELDGKHHGEVLYGFDFDKYRRDSDMQTYDVSGPPSLELDSTTSILDEYLSDRDAQYTKEDGTPERSWVNVTTTLSDLDTSRLHYVKVPENHIVLDFDLKDENGEKSLEKNLAAAALRPPTYAELSKSGKGVHLHYIYEGPDIYELAPELEPGIEIKVYRGNASLRRKLTKCNGLPINKIDNLPIREKKDEKLISSDRVQSEKGLRALIDRNLRKEIHPNTRPSVDFIKKILDDAYEDGLEYDVSDLRPTVLKFASSSTNQPSECIQLVMTMKFKGKHISASEDQETVVPTSNAEDDRQLVFFDVEVFPNVFMIVWSPEGSDTYFRMINPEAHEVEELLNRRLVGFNNRRYDNHILWAAALGYTPNELYRLSQRIINNDDSALFIEAYNAAYADLYDIASVKQGLKKWQYEMGTTHIENHHPWDEDLPEEFWEEVVKYCENDVKTTKQLKDHIISDWKVREMLCALTDLPMSYKTRHYASKLLFNGERNHKSEFVYTDLESGKRTDGTEDISKFPGYSFGYDDTKKKFVSTYRGYEVGEGGFVYAEPGYYENVALIDVASMHPTSIEALNLFGKYTEHFSDIKNARLAIKHGDFDAAKKMMGGKLAPYLTDKSASKDLSNALKLVINSVYGLTSAKFSNDFTDERNDDNIVAKRGALFMIDLMEAVKEQGGTVVHIKTDSIKIADATPELIEFVMNFGKEYGYDFEHEATYERFCLVNNAVYVARENGKWTATGTQFIRPYVFKTLFSGETPTMKDLTEVKSVSKGLIYMCPPEHADDPDISRMSFVGKQAQLIPVKSDHPGGSVPLRVVDGKCSAVVGTKGYLWAEPCMVPYPNVIDMRYFVELAEEAKNAINQYVDFDVFVSP